MLSGIPDKMFSWAELLEERDIEENKKNTVVTVGTSVPVISSTFEAAKIQGEAKRGKGKP